MAIGNGGFPTNDSIEVNELVRDFRLEETTENVKIDRIIVTSINEIKHLDSFEFNKQDYRLMGHNLVKSLPHAGFENGKSYKIVTKKKYEICSECKSETMYDEKSGEHYCPVCYTENEKFLHKILNRVR